MKQIRIWKSKRFYEFRLDNFAYTANGFTQKKLSASDIAQLHKETGNYKFVSCELPRNTIRMIVMLLNVDLSFGGGFGLYVDKNQAVYFKYGIAIGFTLLGFDVYLALTPFRRKLID